MPIQKRFSLLLQDVREREPGEIAESAKMILIEAAKEYIPNEKRRRPHGFLSNHLIK